MQNGVNIIPERPFEEGVTAGRKMLGPEGMLVGQRQESAPLTPRPPDYRYRRVGVRSLAGAHALWAMEGNFEQDHMAAFTSALFTSTLPNTATSSAFSASDSSAEAGAT